MENIQSKYERMAIAVVEQKSIGTERNRLWFGDEVYEYTFRLKCVFVDEYTDGTGKFLNTVWEDFDDNNEYETLFRDLTEEQQREIYNVITCGDLDDKEHDEMMRIFNENPDIEQWYNVYIEPNEITFKSPQDMLQAYKKCMKYDNPYLDSLDEMFFQCSGGRWDTENGDCMVYTRKELERLNEIYCITLDHCTSDCQFSECNVEAELDAEFEEYIYETTDENNPLHQAFMKSWVAVHSARLEWEKKHPNWVRSFKTFRRKQANW